MIDLADEFATAVCSLTPQRIEWLRSADIPDEAIFAEPLMVGASPVETYGGGLYEPRDEGQAAVLVPAGLATATGWDLVDIVAFYLDKPDRWWRRTGEGTLLGTINRFSVEPRRLHRDPLTWLRGQGRGVCVLDWSHDPTNMLLGAGPLVAKRPLLNRLQTTAEKVAAARIKGIVRYG